MQDIREEPGRIAKSGMLLCMKESGDLKFIGYTQGQQRLLHFCIVLSKVQFFTFAFEGSYIWETNTQPERNSFPHSVLCSRQFQFSSVS